MVLALMVNAGEDGDNLSFKMLFYYIYWGANGVGRVVVHLGALVFLIPIPFVVKEPVQGDMEQVTYEKRRAVYRVLSNFTFFVWLLTSLVALRY
jgi:hypothetical protein